MNIKLLMAFTVILSTPVVVNATCGAGHAKGGSHKHAGAEANKSAKHSHDCKAANGKYIACSKSRVDKATHTHSGHKH